jgi:hypothetical protein
MDTKLSAGLMDYLLNYFAEYNARLSERLGLDLRKWWKSEAEK